MPPLDVADTQDPSYTTRLLRDIKDNLHFIRDNRYRELFTTLRLTMIGLYSADPVISNNARERLQRDIDEEAAAKEASLRLGRILKHMEPPVSVEAHTELERVAAKSNVIKEFIADKFLNRLNKDELNETIFPYFANVNLNGLPFDEASFATEPASISQIKKLINVLYYAEQMTLAADQLDVDGLVSFKTVGDLYHILGGPFCENLYKLCTNLTQPDIDLTETFSPEWSMLVKLCNVVLAGGSRFAANSKQFFCDENINVVSGAHDVGLAAGIGIHQLQPNEQGIDYEFVTDLSVNLPKHLDAAANYLRAFRAANLAEVDGQQGLSQQKLNQIEAEGLKLLDAFQGLSPGAFLQVSNGLNIASIVTHACTLSFDIINELNNLTNVSHHLIRDKLAQLKYGVLASAVASAAKLEVELMLKPGQLTGPLVKKLEPIYIFVAQLAENVVPLTDKGIDLRRLDDGKFVKKWVFHSDKNQVEEDEGRLLLAMEKEAMEQFFDELDRSQTDAAPVERLSHLPPETRERLLNCYKILKPQLDACDLKLSYAIANALQSGPKPLSAVEQVVEQAYDVTDRLTRGYARLGLSYLGQLYDGLNWVTGDAIKQRLGAHAPVRATFEDHPDKIARVFDLEGKLSAQFRKKEAQYELRKTLREQMQRHAFLSGDDRVLYPCSDELTARSVSDNPSDQLHALLLSRQQLERALNAQQAFCELLSTQGVGQPFHAVACNNELRNLYAVFQSTLVDELMQTRGQAQDVNLFDEVMVNGLLGTRRTLESYTVQEVLNKVRPALNHGRAQLRQLTADINQMEEASVNTHVQRLLDEPLVLDADLDRLTFLVKKPDYYSKKITNLSLQLKGLFRIFRDDVLQVLNVNNGRVETMLDRFSLASVEPPFPELSRAQDVLLESKQSLMVKRLVNCMHHLKQAAIQMEQLDSSSTQIYYVMQVLSLQTHIRMAAALITDAYSDPYLNAFAGELTTAFNATLTTFDTVRAPFVPKLADNDNNADPAGAIFYVIHSLLITPKQIKALLNAGTISPDTAEDIRKFSMETKEQIDRIIENSDSRVKLVLMTPTFLRLFFDIRDRLTDFAQETRVTVDENLRALVEDALPAMLMEVDRWEAEAALKPGLFSEPVKEILQASLQGFLRPLAVDSRHYVALITSMVPFNKRFIAMNQRLTQAEQTLAGTRGTRTQLTNLSNSLALELLPDEVVEQMHAFSLLFRDEVLQKECTNALTELAQELKFDCSLVDFKRMCSRCEVGELDHAFVTENRAILKRIVDVYGYYFDGRVATEENVLASMIGKKHAVSQERVAQQRLNPTLINDHVKRILHQVLTQYKADARGFIYVRKEYDSELMAYINAAEADALETVDGRHQEIEPQVNQWLSTKINQFDHEHLNVFQQLEGVHFAVEQLRHYIVSQREVLRAVSQTNMFSKGQAWTMFESKATLDRKTRRLEELMALINDETLTVAQRLTRISEKVNSAGFAHDLLAYQNYKPGTFKWLAQCFVAILEACGLYTPQRKLVFSTLVSTSTPPQPDERVNTSMWGIFGGKAALRTAESRPLSARPAPDDSDDVLSEPHMP